MRALGLALFSLSIVALSAGRAGAEPAPERGPALNFVREPGAEACIASVELARLIEARLGRPVFVAAPNAVVVIEGSVRPLAEGGFRALIAVSDGRGALYGSRELLAAHDCRELDEALALVIAVTLRPEGGAASGIALPDDVARSLERLFGDEPADPAPESLPPAQAAAPRAEAEAGDATPAAAPGPAREGAGWSLAIEPGFFLTAGLQPGANYGPLLAARFGQNEFGSVRLQAAFALPTTQDTEDGDRTATTTFYSYLAGLAYCSPELIAGPFAGALCPGLRLGVTRAEADGFVDDLPDVGRTWFAFEVAATVRLQLFGPLAVYLALSAQGRLARARFSYIGADAKAHELFEADPIGAGGELGIALRLF